MRLFASVNAKLLIESFITTPVPGGTTPAPKCRLCDWVAHTRLPAESATSQCVVAAIGLSENGSSRRAAFFTFTGCAGASALACNAAIESVAFRRPLARHRYPVMEEIEQHGLHYFDLDAIEALEKFIERPDKELLEENATLARAVYDLSLLPERLAAVLDSFD